MKKIVSVLLLSVSLLLVPGCCSSNYVRVTPQMKMDDFLFRAKMYTQWYELWQLSKSKEVIDEHRFPNPGGWDIIFSVLVAEGKYWDGYAGTDVKKPDSFSHTLSQLNQTQEQVKAEHKDWASKEIPNGSADGETIEDFEPFVLIPKSGTVR